MFIKVCSKMKSGNENCSDCSDNGEGDSEEVKDSNDDMITL